MAAEREEQGEKGNKEKGIKARVELGERPPAVRGIKLRGRDVVDL